MGRYIVVISAVGVLVLMSVSANRRLDSLTELPMQWGLDGRPTWYAPRRIALAFTPALGAVVLLAISFKETLGAGLAFVIAAAFVSAHALHLAVLLRRLGR